VKNIRKTIGLATIAGALAVAPMAMGTGTAMRTAGSTGMPSRRASRAAIGRPPRVTATTAACSSPWARGMPTAAAVRRNTRAGKRRFRSRRMSCGRRAFAHGRSAAGAASNWIERRCRGFARHRLFFLRGLLHQLSNE
jgi:hypothetical protein